MNDINTIAIINSLQGISQQLATYMIGFVTFCPIDLASFSGIYIPEILFIDSINPYWYDYNTEYHLLNQARSWFLEIVFVRQVSMCACGCVCVWMCVCVCACVCVRPEAMNNYIVA